MHFYLPRRHRRKLLFPPGLLALAGLGCLALRPWQDQLTRRSVMQLTMPPRPVSDEIRPFLGAYHYGPVPRYSALPRLRPWRTITFGRGRRTDSLLALEAARYLSALSQPGTPAQGVRLRFGRHAHYADLVRALSLCDEYNIKKYLLDAYHGPPTLYVIGEALPRRRWHDPLPSPPLSPGAAQAAAGTMTSAPAPASAWWGPPGNDTLLPGPSPWPEAAAWAPWHNLSGGLLLALLLAIFAITTWRAATFRLS